MTDRGFQWQALQARAADRLLPLQALAADPARAERLAFRFDGLHLDLSRCRIDSPLLALAIDQLGQTDFLARRRALFDGEIVNLSEQRPALHPLLRASAPYHPSQLALHRQIRQARERMYALVDALRAGRASELGLIDARCIVNLGIGGSDLGPRLVASALGDERLEVHFVANVDGHAMARLLPKLDARQTLFIVTSKSFSTRETLLNAATAQSWLRQQGVDEAALKRHFLVCSARPDRAHSFGAAEVLPFAEGVGGRYSLWSTVGFAAAAALGSERFQALLAGAEALDRHFLESEPAANLPVLLAIAQACDRVLWGCATRAVVPYDERLALLPAFLQQLEMESNGKSVDDAQQPLPHAAAPVIWGGVGTDGQHAYFQALHQGRDVVPVDFLASIRPQHYFHEHHAVLLANMLAQSAALLHGSAIDPADPLSAARHCPGGRPSTVLLLERLTPASLGALLALYEHKVYVQSRIYGNNPFDQWGVELGKQIASTIEPALLAAAPGSGTFDPTTEALLRRIRAVRG
jgi:glucose-6-phosphate isomerase